MFAVVIAVAASGCSSSSKAAGTSRPKVTAKHAIEPDPDNDVVVVKCADNANEDLGPSATLAITNHASVPSDYIVTVEFRSPAGTAIDTALAGVRGLAHGKRVLSFATSIRAGLRSSKYTCKITDVTRTATAL